MKGLALSFCVFQLVATFAQEVVNDKDSLAHSTAYTLNYDEVVVTAQSKPTLSKDALYDVNVIHKKSLISRGVRQLDQALEVSPKIRLEYDPVFGTQIKMRGMEAQNVAILMDGIPVIGRLDGGIDLGQLSIQNIERIEIIDGPLSNVFGNNASAGVINLITKQCQENPWSIDLSSQVETLGIQSLSGRLGYQTKKWLFAVGGRYYNARQFSTSAYREEETITLADGTSISRMKHPWNPKEQYGINFQTSFRIDDDNRLVLKYDVNVEDVTDYGPLRRLGFNPYAQDGFYNTVRKDGSLLYDGVIQKHWFLNLALGLNSYERTTRLERWYVDTDAFDPDYHQFGETRFNTFFARLNLNRRIDEQLSFTLGATATREKGQGDRIIDEGRADSSQATFFELASYGEACYSPAPSFKASLSGRVIHHSAYGFAFTPALHLKYNISDKILTRASYAVGYRNPGLKELHLSFIDVNHFILGNPELAPEYSHDIRASLEMDKQRLLLGLNIYYTLLRDRIALIEYEDLQFRYDNVGSYTVFGIELNGSYKFKTLFLQSSAHLGLWSTGLEGGSDGPRHSDVLDMNHQLQFNGPHKVNAMINYRLVGRQVRYRQVASEIRTSTLSSVSYLDVSLNRSFLSERLLFTLGVRNLFDIREARLSGSLTTGGAHNSPGPRPVSQGRNAFVSLNFNF